MKLCRLVILCLCLGLSSGLSGQSVRSFSPKGYLDADGDFLVTYSLSHLQRLVDGLLPCFSQQNRSGDSDWQKEQASMELTKDLVTELGFRHLKSVGVSGKTVSADHYLYRGFVGVGPEATGCLFNTSCLSESEFVLFDRLPQDTLLAVELNLNLLAMWSAGKASLNHLSSKHEVPENIQGSFREMETFWQAEVGVELSQVLKATRGVCSLAVIRTSGGPGFCLSLPDSDGTVLALLKSHGDISHDMKLLGQPPLVEGGGKVVVSSGRLIIYSSPAVESAMTGGFRGYLRKRGYLGDFDGRGVGYFYVRSLSQVCSLLGGMPVSLDRELSQGEFFGYGQRTMSGLPLVLRSSVVVQDVIPRSFPPQAIMAVTAPAFPQACGLGVAQMVLLESLSRAREKARQIRCISNLKQIGLGTLMYALDHDDCYPREAGVAGLSKLKEYVGDAAVFICPNDRDVWEAKGQLTSHNCSYIYLGGGKMSQIRNASVYPLVFERLNNHRGGVNIYFADGHAEFIKTNDLERTIRSYLDRSGVDDGLKQRLLRELRNQLR